MNQFSLLIKPSSADCNLKCEYCFYLEKSKLYPSVSAHRMSYKTLEIIISSYMQTSQPQYSFAWQGGEPTLMGVDFFRKVTELQIKYGRPGASIANHLQTNATLITDDLAKHLYKYNFLVGISLDGPADIHDQYRTYRDGRGSHEQVIKGLNILRKHRVETNILTLINSDNVNKGCEIFNYLKKQGVMYHQYIPCVEFDRFGNKMPYTVTPEAWGKFLCTVFDNWHANSDQYISIRYFDAILYYLVTGKHILCHMDHSCSKYFLVEHNGDAYPCDFFADKSFYLGNLYEKSWNDLLVANQYAQFRNYKSEWNSDCNHCKYLQLCSGDCLKHRLNHGARNSTQKSWLCKGYKMFFDYAFEKFEKMALKIIAQRKS